MIAECLNLIISLEYNHSSFTAIRFADYTHG